ncbi:hypothetical protein K788_0007995 [Paraburkholderia caribensis MBA4]|uniref:Uncharacterized protein n=1 Tax=Paraburkholderia caribensis MBA4 TaxID=1323664 RepID=A0A0P0R5Z4_9BURK|nr:hypothetical protein [Paraburkholderia caribensis]ALL63327.1 hypothetical protein K788_0007995 [Paraburkholderia caribensis MBA4]
MFLHRYPRRPLSLTGRKGAFALAALLCLSPAAVETTAYAATAASEIQVSLTIHDVCTMNTDAVQPKVACSAGAPFRVYRDGYFARGNEPALGFFATAAHDTAVEIAF